MEKGKPNPFPACWNMADSVIVLKISKFAPKASDLGQMCFFF